MTAEKKDEIYSRYLETRHWWTVKNDALQLAGFKCQLCATTDRLVVHHNSYERITCEYPEDLFVVCADCHTLFHSKKALHGMSLASVNYASLLVFVESEEAETDDREWFPVLSGHCLVKPQRHAVGSLTPTGLTTAEYDRLAGDFNILPVQRRRSIVNKNRFEVFASQCLRLAKFEIAKRDSRTETKLSEEGDK